MGKVTTNLDRFFKWLDSLLDKVSRVVQGSKNSHRQTVLKIPSQLPPFKALGYSYLLWTVMDVQLGQHKATGVLNSWDEESWLMVLTELEEEENQMEGHQDPLESSVLRRWPRGGGGMQVLDRRPRFHSISTMEARSVIFLTVGRGEWEALYFEHLLVQG